MLVREYTSYGPLADDQDEVFKNVRSGIKPDALDKVVDPEVRRFIDKCIAPVSVRWSATDLLNEFVFSLDNDTVSLVVEEMIQYLMLSTEDATLITQLMETLITELVPDFRSSQMSSPTKDDLNLHSLPMTESVGDVEDHDAKDHPSALTDCSSDRKASISQVQKVEADGKRKLKPFSSRLKKLLFSCWKPL